MISFISLIVISILFGILAIIFLVAAIVCVIRGNERKYTILSTIATLSGMIITFVTSLNIDIPKPIIYPLDNEIRKYTNSAEVAIETDGLTNDLIKTDAWFYTYYSTDGTDPKQGNIYIKPFTITESTTISARNKFLIWWSGISQNVYKFDEQLETEMKSEEETAQPTSAPVPKTQQPTESDKTVAVTESNTTITPPGTEPVSPPETTTLQPISPQTAEGQQFDEASKMLTYINQYRINAGVPLLNWDDELADSAQQIAYSWAYEHDISDGIQGPYSCDMVARRTMGPVTITAETVVSAWITGNNDISSESNTLLSEKYTAMGGAMYYCPDSKPFHYFWVVIFR